MSDYGDFCREQRQRQQAHRRARPFEVTGWEDEMRKLKFSVEPVGAGKRFTHKHRDGTIVKIDWWPQSGKWTHVGTNTYRTGERAMIKYAKAHTTREGKIETSTKPVASGKPREWRPTGPGNPPWRT